jgi:hypothetical protein
VEEEVLVEVQIQVEQEELEVVAQEQVVQEPEQLEQLTQVVAEVLVELEVPADRESLY